MQSTLKRKLWITLFLLAAGAGVAFSGFLFGMAECYFPPMTEWKRTLLNVATLLSCLSFYSWLPVLIIQWCCKKYRIANLFLYVWTGVAILSQLGWLCCNG